MPTEFFPTSSRSFFSALFEPASSIPIGNRIIYSNHSIKLLVLIGFLRNFQKCDLNLPDISCSGSPLLCLCVKIFCFVIVFKFLPNIFVSFELRHTSSLEIFFCCDLRRSALYRLRM